MSPEEVNYDLAKVNLVKAGKELIDAWSYVGSSRLIRDDLEDAIKATESAYILITGVQHGGLDFTKLVSSYRRDIVKNDEGAICAAS